MVILLVQVSSRHLRPK